MFVRFKAIQTLRGGPRKKKCAGLEARAGRAEEAAAS